MKELLDYLNDVISMFRWLLAFAFFSLLATIAAIAYNFYPIITLTVVGLTIIGWIAEIFKQRKSKSS